MSTDGGASPFNGCRAVSPVASPTGAVTHPVASLLLGQAVRGDVLSLETQLFDVAGQTKAFEGGGHGMVEQALRSLEHQMLVDSQPEQQSQESAAESTAHQRKGFASRPCAPAQVRDQRSVLHAR